jgi:hypothetical protein
VSATTTDQTVLGLLARFYHCDFNHPVAINQRVERLANLVFWPKRPKALDLADRDWGWGDSYLHDTSPTNKSECPYKCANTFESTTMICALHI